MGRRGDLRDELWHDHQNDLRLRFQALDLTPDPTGNEVWNEVGHLFKEDLPIRFQTKLRHIFFSAIRVRLQNRPDHARLASFWRQFFVVEDRLWLEFVNKAMQEITNRYDSLALPSSTDDKPFPVAYEMSRELSSIHTSWFWSLATHMKTLPRSPHFDIEGFSSGETEASISRIQDGLVSTAISRLWHKMQRNSKRQRRTYLFDAIALELVGEFQAQVQERLEDTYGHYLEDDVFACILWDELWELGGEAIAGLGALLKSAVRDQYKQNFPELAQDE